MFCNQCGKENSSDSKFCSTCGNQLESGGIQTLTQKQLWNPNIAFILGFFFTFIFTSVIYQENWKELGFQKKMLVPNVIVVLMSLFALYSLYFMYKSGNGFLLEFYYFYPTILGANIWFMVLLYFISAKTQIEYIAFNYENYQKKSFIGYSLLASIFIVMFWFQLKLALLG